MTRGSLKGSSVQGSATPALTAAALDSIIDDSAGLASLAELSTWGPLLRLIKQAQHRQNRAIELALSPLGLSLVQWNALVEIRRNPGESLRSLAEHTFTSDQAFGMLAARLIRLGLVARRSGAGRASIHELTDQGRAKLMEGAALIADAATQLFKSLDLEKRRQLEALLQHIVD